MRQDASTVLYAVFAAYQLQPCTTATWCRAALLLRAKLADDWCGVDAAAVRTIITSKWSVHEDEVVRSLRDHSHSLGWAELSYLQVWLRANIAVVDVESGQLLRQNAQPLHPKTIVLAFSARHGVGVFEIDGALLLDRAPPGIADGY